MTEPQKKVAIVGSGLIGRSWSMLFAGVGYNVVLYDIVPSQVENALTEIGMQLSSLEKSGMLRGKLSAKSQHSLITGTSSLEELVKHAFFILECVPELLELKRKPLEQIDLLMDDGAILASSTSAILPSKLAVGLKHADSFIVTHPVNPPYYVPLVELVPSPWTKPEVVTQTKSLMLEIGQSPVTITKELPGFALNRLQYALMNECYNLVEDGILSPEDVDIGFSDGIGRRYAFLGVFQTCHLNAHGMKDYLDRYRETIYKTSKEMGNLRKMEGKTADVICQSLFKRIPLEKLGEARQKRDSALIKLSKIRRDIPYRCLSNNMT